MENTGSPGLKQLRTLLNTSLFSRESPKLCFIGLKEVVMSGLNVELSALSSSQVVPSRVSITDALWLVMREVIKQILMEKIANRCT